MIRLPPSSISLSERDIDFHLRQAEMYHGLMRQGFRKDDVVRYLNDYHEASLQTASQELQGFNLNIPSTFELSCSPSRPCLDSEDDEQEPPGNKTTYSSSTRSTDDPNTPFPDLPLDGQDSQDDVHEDVRQDSPPSPTSSVPIMLVNQHAPRKSSLLRFAKMVSPERSSTQSEDERMVPAKVLTSRPKIYKRRSNTYPYQSSERESTGDTLPHDDVVERMHQMSLVEDNMSDDLLDGIPCAPSTSFSGASRMHSAADISFASPIVGPSAPDGSSDYFEVSGLQRIVARRPSSSLMGRPSPTLDASSSPPLPRTPARRCPRSPQASPKSPQLPSTPTPIRNAGAITPIEPRNYRNQLDGNAFAVYNDSLPATSQPQTPADLSRLPLITEHDTAYTAPPGMIHVESSTQRGRNGWDRESGEQSPTARAINLRERRNRELTRSVRAEGVRLHRLRLRDEAIFTQRALHTNGVVQAEVMPQLQTDVWRDDLDVDRVGEENFEAELEVGPRRVMRAVSGNARFDG